MFYFFNFQTLQLLNLLNGNLGQYVQYAVVIVIVIGALLWLFRKTLFPKRYSSNNCGDGDCGCH